MLTDAAFVSRPLPAALTQAVLPDEGVNVIAALLHAHLAGTKLVLRQIRCAFTSERLKLGARPWFEALHCASHACIISLGVRGAACLFVLEPAAVASARG